MSKLVNFMVKDHSVTLIFSDGPRTITAGQPSFKPLLEALRKRDFEEAERIANPTQAIHRFSRGNIEIVGSAITYKGEEIGGYLVKKIFQFIRDDLPWEHLVAFLDNLQSNESRRAREELYRFLETEDMPVTEDGHFLAYKVVRENWKDIYSDTIDNSVGQVVQMPRRAVDDNQAIGCSAGLHAGSLEYVRNFSSRGHIIIVKINPADVVCIPQEDVRKLRCCRYEVLKEMDKKLLYPSYSNDGHTPRGSLNSDYEFGAVAGNWDEVGDEVFDDIEFYAQDHDLWDDDENHDDYCWEGPTEEYDISSTLEDDY